VVEAAEAEVVVAVVEEEVVAGARTQVSKIPA